MSVEKTKIGSKWGNLTVLKKLERDKSGHRFLECKCDCGNVIKVRSSQLRSGDSKTCRKCPPTNTYEFKDGIVTGKCAGGSVFIIDSSDFETLRNYQWCNSKGYIVTTINKRTVFMHKFLFRLQRSKTIVDHINGNKSDNRRSNLRMVTSSQNNQNQHCGGRGKIKYRGVDVHTQNNKYRARIGFHGKAIHLGCFRTPELAAQARNIASDLLHGEYAGTINDVSTPSQELYEKIYHKCKPFLQRRSDYIAVAS